MAPHRQTPGQLVHEFIVNLDRSAGGSGLEMMQESGITLPQMIALHRLSACPSMAVSELAQDLGMAMSTVSVLVQRLVLKQWASRTENPLDRRAKLLAITKSGEALISSLERQRTASLSKGMQSLPNDLQQEMLGIMNKCVVAMRLAAQRKTI
jgi:MarR family transcriptional regulator, organic hydroperoxide resistance regulator